MGKALYRKYRSKSLADIVGQSHITSILSRAVEQGKTSHAYLLTGPRGVGKTSIARILAREINKLPYTDDTPHIDIIEIDAASNNGVDDIRDMREKIQVVPAMADKKVYIIDEVHMLSKPAFNALLKTLEEPPEHAVFILATTDVDKLPETIVSRTQHFGFRTISHQDLVKHLGEIAKSEKIKISDEALALIAEHGDGSFRDSISLLDQMSSLVEPDSEIDASLLESILGLASHKLLEQLIAAYRQSDLSTIVELLDEAASRGVQPVVLSSQLIEHLRREIAKHPELIILLDDLLEVSSSSRPDIKLLTALAPKQTAAKQRPAPLLATKPEIVLEAPIPELTKKATQKHPKDPKPAAKPAKSTPKTTSVTPVDFNWDDLVEHVRKNHVAVYSVISKCGHQIDGNLLTIYTGNNFYKKKLDDSKYRLILVQSLEEVGVSNLDIDTVPTASPLKDEQAAKVAAIMGGGEEVTV